MAKRVLLIGANGQLGSDLRALLPAERLVPLTHAELDVTDAAGVRATLAAQRPDVVLNTAAFHRVDDIEDDPTRAFAVNVHGARNLALACRAAGCALMHISTDYVFDGRKRTPYVESDAANPANGYGISKLAGELYVRAILPQHYVVRTSGLYGVAGASGKGGNFVELMLRLAREGRDVKVVDDQTLTPTYTADLAVQLAALLDTEDYGLYHATAQGACTWYEFAERIYALSGTRPKSLARQTTAQSGARATRPAYSVLANAALRALGLDRMRHWEEALAAYLDARRERDAAQG
jgi:dTDP-4-dehydrorhamnose reductase